MVKLVKSLVKLIANFGAVGDGSDKGNLGKGGKISNFGAVGNGSDKGSLDKVGKISNFGAVGDGSDKGKHQNYDA